LSKKPVDPNEIKYHVCGKQDFLKLDKVNQICFKTKTGSTTFKVSERLHWNTIFIAEHDGQPVAYVFGIRSQVKPEEGWIRQIATIPEYRRLGIAEKLQNMCVDAFRKMPGVKHVGLTVEAENVPAINLYKKLGFEVAETEPGYETVKVGGYTAIRDYYGPGEHRLIMIKKI